MNRAAGLYIGHTDHKGRGVFTAQAIAADSIIEICQVLILPKHENPIIHKTSLHDYYFLWGEDLDRFAIALGYGSLYNHEVNPNANFILDLANDTIDIIAIKDIEAGEEITINYHGEPGCEDELWF